MSLSTVIALTLLAQSPGSAQQRQWPSVDPAPSTPVAPAGSTSAPPVADSPGEDLGEPPANSPEPSVVVSPEEPVPATNAAPTAEADIVVTARPPGDPLRVVNQQSFAATQKVDAAITGPAALAYKRVVPDPVRSGLRNFFNNLHEPNVALNYLLQLKPGKSAETFGRFALNTTLGVAGLFDVAKRRPFKLPRRRNGFADTLGYYGVGPGPFFFLPLIGPTTARDFAGGGVDRLLGVSFLHGPFGGRAYVASTAAIRILDRRAESDDRVRTVRESADPYETRRSLYMKMREAEIQRLHGRDRARSPVAPTSSEESGASAAPEPAATSPALR